MTQPITVRKSEDRGHADHGWLTSKHTFSFAGYRDPEHMGFRSLRVINQDQVAPGSGFPEHPHSDMEIFSYVLEGSLEHRDSMGNARVLKPGEIQLMSAGSGITHSEFNPSPTEPLHFLQIWIKPQSKGLEPAYTEWRPTAEAEANRKVLLISPDGREGSASIRQDVDVYRVSLEPNTTTTHEVRQGRALWLQVIKGPLLLRFGERVSELASGDAASSESQGGFSVVAEEKPVEALLFDLA